MKCRSNSYFPVPQHRLITWVMLILIGIAGWSNARYWVGHYSRVGVALSMTDYAGFTQRVSLIPPLIVPLMMLHHGSLHTGVYAKRYMYLYSSRSAYWRVLSRDALVEAVLGGLMIMAFSILPVLGSEVPLSIMNWGGVGSLFTLMTGSPIQTEASPVLVFGAYLAAACLQILAYLLLYGLLECRFPPFAAFLTVLLFNLAFNSPVRSSVWDWAGLGYGCWAKPFGAAILLAGWVALIVLLYFMGHIAYRKVDVL